MNSLDDLPQRDRSHDTAEAAETAFRAAIEACKLFIIQPKDPNDYGTDFQIEARDGNAMTNIRAHVQLKGTESAANTNGSVSVAVARRNLNYLLAQADSLYVCYHLPSGRLLVCYAEDVYRDYEHRGANWTHQKDITVNFSQLFNKEFQCRLNARLLASGRLSRDRRLQWITTPPEQISYLILQSTVPIHVPDDPMQAQALLIELYNNGNDAIISNNFMLFSSVLDSLPGAMDIAYMAEINLGINRSPFDNNRVRQGIHVLYDAMKRGDTHPWSLLYCIGNAWLALGESHKALEAYHDALMQIEIPEFASFAAQCYKNMGSAIEGIGEIDAARVFYEKSIELAPDLCEAHFALALWHRRKGDYPLALIHLDRIFRLNDSALQMSAVQGWRIELLFNTGDIDGAFREINSLISESNQIDWVWPWCARQVANFGRISVRSAQKALQFWNIFLCKYPNHNIVERERLLCLWRIHVVGEHTEIDFEGFKLALIQIIKNGDPDSAFLWDRMGHWAQYDGNWIEAEKAYRKAYEIEPERYGYCFGTALNFLNRYGEALPILLRQAEEYQPDALSWFQVAMAREGIGDIEGSISAYQRAIELDVDYDLAWFNLGGLYWNSQDIVRANNVWGEAIRRFPDHELARKLRRKFPFL